MKFRSMLALCVSLFLLLIASPSLLAQTAGTGALSGTVTDPSGAVVPNVTVTATSVDTGAVRTATTGGDGSYIISLLQPGNYRVRFDAAGFKPVEVPSVTITVTENGTLNQALTVGAQTQEVTIQADVETVQTSNGAVGTVVNNVAEIPLATRNYVNLLGLSAGANSTINNAASALGKGTQAIAVNGAATSDNNYQMDGVSVVTFQSSGGVGEAGTFSAFGVPNPDAVQEFKIQTSSFDASYGRNSGGNVNMVTKSGTNEFHGNLFEYFRNTVLNANDFFKKDSEVCAHSATGVSSFFGCTPGTGPYAGNAANIRPAVDQNQYGATLGGPIKKDKLFVFLSYQETDQKNGLATAGFSTFTLPYISPASFGPRGSNAWLVDMYNHYCGQTGSAGGSTGIEFEPAPVAIGGSGVCPNPSVAAVAAANQHPPVVLTPAQIALYETASIGPNPSSLTNVQPLNVLEIAAPSATTNGTAYYIPSVLDLPKTSPIQCSLTGKLLSNNTSLDPLNYSSCTASIPAIYHEYQGVGNFDYVVNSKNTLSGRFFSSIDPTLSPFGVGGSVPGFPAKYQALNDEAILRLTTVLSNNMVNEARISFQRNSANDSEGAPFTSSSAGIQPVSPNVELFPQSNLGGFSIGAYQFGVANSLDNQYEYADQLSWTHGKQTLRFGFEAERDLWNYSFPALDIGALTFGNFADFLTDLPAGACPVPPATIPPACAASLGTPIGLSTTDLAGHTVQANGTGSSSLSVGSATTLFSTPALNGPGSTLGYDHHYRATSFDSFVQDDIKINKRLTVNLGLRWEWDGYVTELEGENVTADDSRMLGQPFTFSTGGTAVAPCVGVVYPAPCAGGTLQGFVVPRNFNTSILGPIPTGVAQRSHDYASAAVPPKDDFAPRLGFAWQPLSTNKFVVRGGAGMFYNRIPGDNYIHTVLQNFPTAYTIPSFINADLAWPYGIPKAGWGYRWVYTQTGSPNTLSSQLGGGGLEMAEKLTVPLTYEWSLNTQYEFLRGWVIEVGYVGSHGIHQFTTGQLINLSPLVSTGTPAANGSGATTDTTGNTALRTIYPGFSNTYTNEATVGSFLYNSAQVTLRKQMSHGLLFQAAYTFSRGYTATPLGYGNPNADLPGQYPEITAYVPNTAYHPQRLAVSYSYDLPFGHHSGLVGKATEGWTVSGITIIQDGTPLTVTDSRLGTIFGGGNSAAQLCGGATLSQIETPGSLFDRVVSGLTNGNGYINKAPFSSNSTAGGNIINCSQFFPVAGNSATNPLWANFGSGAGDGDGPVGGFLGPGQFNTDVTLLKSTRVGGIREDGTLIFRAEFLNAFNHPQFSNPTVAMGGSLGKITSASVNPRLIQFALKYQF